MWERELMGLYISAHPLDQYGKYFAEQTFPIGSLTKGDDGKKVTVGGLISTIRTIVTKKGTKMAFIGLEDKTGNMEVVVFPKTYQQMGEQLKQDVAIRIEGVVNARDRNGELMSDVKVNAETIMVVTDQELRDYEPTGQNFKAPKAGGVTTTRKPWQAKAAAPTPAIKSFDAPKPVAVTAAKKLYVNVKDPDDQATLLKLKQVCRTHPGTEEIVLVLGSDKKSAIKLPFTVDSSEQLVGDLVKLLGEDGVVVK